MSRYKKTIILLFNLTCLCWTTLLIAQADYDLRLTLDTIDCSNKTVCYDVQLRSADGNTWGLAGQNYRLYYDGALAAWQSGTSTLPTANYQSFSLIQNIQNVDASTTMGALAFEGNLSFLNYTMDLNTPSTGGVNLPADGSWVTTTQLCFLMKDTLINNPSACLEVVWARDGVTNDYATSFVEVSEWIEPDNTQMAIGQDYDGLDASDGTASCITDYCFPPEQYDIRLVFDSIDCINQMGCFNVQLRSANGDTWGLAGQNYRLYYDASLASWQSGISTLSNDYQTFSLIQDIQDVDASATNSNLAFEETLGFLNYTMDLVSPTTGGDSLLADGTWKTTSQLCFFLEDSLLEAPSTCLEVIWARDTLTAAYATSFVEVAEWVASDSTQMADGNLYDDLDATDANDACFDGVCVYDFGDLPDIANGTTGINDYETYDSTGGPSHLIVEGLFLGDTVDIDADGIPHASALGDDEDNIDDEDGLIFFNSLNITPGGKMKIPLDYVNTTGDTAYIEAWVDWNGDGDFMDMNELVFDEKDPTSGLFTYVEITIPSIANLGQQLGFRIRLSNEDNMTPYGVIGSGEVEDYLIQVSCRNNSCLPVNVEVVRQN